MPIQRSVSTQTIEDCCTPQDKPRAYLHEVLLGLIHASHIVKGYACVGLHLKLGAALAKVEGVVATWAAQATALAPAQQEQTTHQQQRESQVACTDSESTLWKHTDVEKHPMASHQVNEC